MNHAHNAKILYNHGIQPLLIIRQQIPAKRFHFFLLKQRIDRQVQPSPV